ncbi:hypothetical protein ACWEQL_13820 [Kitasatospora sp. NPDC004240]
MAGRGRLVAGLAVAVPVVALMAWAGVSAAADLLLADLHDECAGRQAREAELDRLDAFTLLPGGARELPESASPAGCVQDSGFAWLYAARDYDRVGGEADVLAFYGGALPGLGWRSEGPPPSPAVTLGCFTRRTGSGWETLTVGFPREPGAAGVFRLSVEASVDGSKIDC